MKLDFNKRLNGWVASCRDCKDAMLVPDWKPDDVAFKQKTKRKFMLDKQQLKRLVEEAEIAIRISNQTIEHHTNFVCAHSQGLSEARELLKEQQGMLSSFRKMQAEQDMEEYEAEGREGEDDE